VLDKDRKLNRTIDRSKHISPEISPVFGEPSEFAAAVAPVWSENHSRRYGLSEGQARASEKPKASE
jgi:hypothetical protein